MFWFAQKQGSASPAWVARVGMRALPGRWLEWEAYCPPEVTVDDVVVSLDETGDAWLVIDPVGWFDGCSSSGTVWTFAPQCPKDIARCVMLAARGFHGVILADVDSVAGLWGRRGPDHHLWRHVRRAAERGLCVVHLRLGGHPVPSQLRAARVLEPH